MMTRFELRVVHLVSIPWQQFSITSWELHCFALRLWGKAHQVLRASGWSRALRRGVGGNLCCRDTIGTWGEMDAWTVGMGNCSQLPQKPTNQGDRKVNKDQLNLTYTFSMLDVCIYKIFAWNGEHPFLSQDEIFTKINQDFSFHLLVERQCHRTVRLQGEPLKMNFLECLLHSLWTSRYVYIYMSHFILMDNENTIIILPMRQPRVRQ